MTPFISDNQDHNRQSQTQHDGKAFGKGVAIGAGIGIIGSYVASLSASAAWATTESTLGEPQPIFLQSEISITSEQEMYEFLELAHEANWHEEDINKMEAIIRDNLENGVEIKFSDQLGTGSYGEYNPSSNTIEIMPEALLGGHQTLLETLTHETVHAHQDAADGIWNSSLQPVGLGINNSGIEVVESYYTEYSFADQVLEAEAHSATEDIEATLDSLDIL